MQSEDDRIFDELGHVVEKVREFVEHAKRAESNELHRSQMRIVRKNASAIYDRLGLVLLHDDDLILSATTIYEKGEEEMSLLNLRKEKDSLESDDPYITEITQAMLNEVAALTGKHPRAIAGLLAIADRKQDGPARKSAIDTFFFEKGEYDPIIFPEKPPVTSDDDLIFVSTDASRPNYSLVGQWWPERERVSQRIFEIFNDWRGERGRYLARIAKRKREARLAQRKIERLQKEFKLEAA